MVPNELGELIDWYRTHQPTEVRVHQILKFGTDSDKILLELFVRFGRVVEAYGDRATDL